MKKLLFFFLGTVLLLQSCGSSGKHLTVGEKVPLFSLKDQNGTTFNSADYVGKKIMVIYFYPKDESGVCTKEACAFRDSYEEFTKAGAMVVGINNESVETHKKFQANHNLPFTILSDPNKEAINGFGVKPLFAVLTGRETFVVDLNGKIAYQYNSASEGEKHSSEALTFIKNMK